MTIRVRQLEDQSVGVKQNTFSQIMNVTCKQDIGKASSVYVLKNGLDSFAIGRAAELAKWKVPYSSKSLNGWWPKPRGIAILTF